MSFASKFRVFFHLSVPAVVDEGKITIPSFEIPLTEELSALPIEGAFAVEVEPETQTAVAKVALKKKLTRKKPAKKTPRTRVTKKR